MAVQSDPASIKRWAASSTRLKRIAWLTSRKSAIAERFCIRGSNTGGGGNREERRNAIWHTGTSGVKLLHGPKGQFTVSLSRGPLLRLIWLVRQLWFQGARGAWELGAFNPVKSISALPACLRTFRVPCNHNAGPVSWRFPWRFPCIHQPLQDIWPLPSLSINQTHLEGCSCANPTMSCDT